MTLGRLIDRGRSTYQIWTFDQLDQLRGSTDGRWTHLTPLPTENPVAAATHHTGRAGRARRRGEEHWHPRPRRGGRRRHPAVSCEADMASSAEGAGKLCQLTSERTWGVRWRPGRHAHATRRAGRCSQGASHRAAATGARRPHAGQGGGGLPLGLGLGLGEAAGWLGIGDGDPAREAAMGSAEALGAGQPPPMRARCAVATGPHGPPAQQRWLLPHPNPYRFLTTPEGSR